MHIVESVGKFLISHTFSNHSKAVKASCCTSLCNAKSQVEAMSRHSKSLGPISQFLYPWRNRKELGVCSATVHSTHRSIFLTAQGTRFRYACDRAMRLISHSPFPSEWLMPAGMMGTAVVWMHRIVCLLWGCSPCRIRKQKCSIGGRCNWGSWFNLEVSIFVSGVWKVAEVV